MHTYAHSHRTMITPKVFNAAEMRVKGTELEKYAKRNAVANGGRGRGRKGKGEGKPPPRGFDDTPVGGGARAPASKWRQQSSQFRDAIRQVGDKRGRPFSFGVVALNTRGRREGGGVGYIAFRARARFSHR